MVNRQLCRKVAGLALSLVIGFLSGPRAWADEVTRRFTNSNSVPLPSAALVDDVTALPINPGAGGATDFFDLYLSKSIDPTTAGQFNVFAGFPGLSLGFQQFDGQILGDLRKFSIGYALPVHDFVSVGAAYHFTQQLSLTSANVHTFDAGVLFRPASFLSIGAALKNINAPGLQEADGKAAALKRSYVAGVGVRPFDDRLTITADAQWDEGDQIREMTGLFGVEAEPLDGIILRGMVDTRGHFGFDISLRFNHVQAGYFHTFNAPKNYDAAHVKITNETFQSIFQMSPSFAYIDLTRGLQVDNAEPSFNLLQQRRTLPLWSLLEQINRIQKLKNYAGLILEIGHLGVGLGIVEEMRNAIQQLRQSGKHVIAYVTEAGMAEYYLASAADQVIMHPLGHLELTGFGYVLPHYKELLDKIGVEVEFIKVGKYKTGLESYTQQAPSEPTQEQLGSIQQNTHQRYVDHLVKNRQMDATQVEKIFSKGLFTATEAKEVGLIDRSGYKDELEKLAAEAVHQPQIQIHSIGNVALHDPSWESRDKIAVIYASGSIVEGYSGNDILFGEQFVGSRSLTTQIRRAGKDSRIKALVLRVNSPGGSALASDEIYRALQQVKQETGKPIIVSMGDVAASGGYWIALASDKIVANPSTITGSIGIFAGKPNLKKLYEQIGVNHTVIKSGPHADANGMHRPYTEEERQTLLNHLREYYRIFLERVSSNRKLDIQQVEQVAQGRVYTGQQAMDQHLVDQLGGLETAIGIARAMANIKTKEIEIVHLPEPEGLLDRAIPDLDLGASVRLLFPQGLSILAIME